jgi:catechol 2,3-dioxygenase-like lactoylglutathione lyase family enzyme
MSIIKIEDIAHVRFSAPNLEEMRRFLVEFGVQPLPLEGDVLYARGSGPTPFLHATSLGPPSFDAIGLRAQSIGDLERLATTERVQVEDFAAPGGGKVVRLKDPDGRNVEIVADQTQVEHTPLNAEPSRNSVHSRSRFRSSVRIPEGPASVVRLGHAVFCVRDFRSAAEWYKSRFGFLTSDEVEATPGAAIGAFLRCDRGDVPTDHHTLFLIQTPDAPSFDHAAFEVASFDDLMRGHSHLHRAKRTPAWGIGRHVLGSQIFDYWRDPWGHQLEHWTDGDLFTAADGSHQVSLQELLGVQWGPVHPVLANTQGKHS